MTLYHKIIASKLLAKEGKTIPHSGNTGSRGPKIKADKSKSITKKREAIPEGKLSPVLHCKSVGLDDDFPIRKSMSITANESLRRTSIMNKHMIQQQQQQQLQAEKEGYLSGLTEQLLYSEKHSTTTGKKTKKKSVHFATLATVVTIPEVTKEEARQCWYRPEDYRKFEIERAIAVVAINWALDHSTYLNPDECTVLGLEHHLSRQSLYERRMRLLRHSHYVLKQQQHLKQCGVYDMETVRYVSELFSSGRIDNILFNNRMHGYNNIFQQDVINMNTSPKFETAESLALMATRTLPSYHSPTLSAADI